MILLIDNYDSFTYNLYHYLGELGADVRVYLNDKITLDEIAALKPEKIVISPGPCTPREAGISCDAIKRFAVRIPILGVCLGHQSIGAAFGGKIVRAPSIMHGKLSEVTHDSRTIFRQVKISDRVAQTVMSESAFNDATGAILTVAVLTVAMGSGEFSLAASFLDLLKQAAIGIVAGAVLGYLAALLIAHERWALLVEYAPVVTLIAVIGAYFAADELRASGFMAVFVLGIVIGNKESFGFKMPAAEARKLDEFVMTSAFIMRLFIFLLLGSQVDFNLIAQYWFGGVTVVVAFVLIARPLTVFLCALPDRRAKWSFNEMLFMCWTRETGVIPAALAGLLLGMKAPGAEIVASVTFIAILMTILIQAPTTKWLAQRLGLLEEGKRARTIRVKQS